MTLGRRLSALVLPLLMAGAAQAHDFWLEPVRMSLDKPGVVSLEAKIGHGDGSERWAGGPVRVVRYTVDGPGGRIDRTQAFKQAGAATDMLRLDAPGAHMIALETSPVISVLQPAKFESYLKEEGLTPILALRKARGLQSQPGRESYSRRAKALLQVGPVDDAAVALATKANGAMLEIVPMQHPMRVADGASLPITILYRGRPLAGAQVALHRVGGSSATLARVVTGRDGTAAVALPGRGSYRLNTVWSVPQKSAKADYATIFASLTFAH
jgi:Domain of unknown function (DUF4198)